MDGRERYPKWKLEGVHDDAYACPRRAITPESGRWLDLFHHYDKGHLLRSGAIEDQPALFMDAMKTITQAIAAARAESMSG